MVMEKWMTFPLAGCLFIAGFLSLFASPEPDGLERVAEDQGFIGNEEQLFSAPMPDYAFEGISNEILSASAAGIAGTILMFAIVFAAGKTLRG